MTRNKVHTQYMDDMYQPLPSVTTVLNVISKPALLHWAWQCGIDGIDYKKERDIKAGIGTLVHKMILCHLKGEDVDTREYAKEDIDKAETCFIKYLEWERQNPFEAHEVEVPMVSKKYSYGGTPDLVCWMKDINQYTIIDFKSGKAIYEPEMPAQLAAYNMLAEEYAGISCRNWRIVRIGRDEKEGFEVRSYDSMEDYWQVFKAALTLYYAINKVKGRD